ncbi:MAG TPA: hypothetical protein PKY12_00680 [Catalimonadaceae bacterium]|nr:hypothetical protein [Catalimonadaceae bacterium]
MSQTLDLPSQKQVDELLMERERLLGSTQKYKSALENQVADMKENAMKWGIQAMMFGGVALGTYLLVRAFQSKGSKKGKSREVAKTSFTSALFASIQSYIISFLLSLAREQIMAYLEKTILSQNAPNQKPKGETV